MKNKAILLILVGLVALVACAPSGGETTTADAGQTQLSSSDLSAVAQLALGTVQLEETEQAISETQAAELLPLWQAYQSLADSDTTATVELDALVAQIQRAMTAEQIQAIAGMELTGDTLTALQESGELGFGFGGRGGDGAAATSGDSGGFEMPEEFAAPGGGAAAGGGAAPGGGQPPAGGFGGGPGGGGGMGGPMGGDMGDMSEDDLATRQAAMADMDPAEMQSRMLTGMVIRLLQTKTGEMPAGGPGGGMGMGGPSFDVALTAAAEATGLSVDDLRAQMAEGQTLTAIIETNGGDVATVRAALIEALSAQPEAAEMDVEQMAERLLGGGQAP